jgi:hypothetical protein
VSAGVDTIQAALSALFAQAVAEANKPLVEKIDALTAEVAALRAERTAEVLDSRAMAARYNKPSVEAFNRWITPPKPGQPRRGGVHVGAIAKTDPAGRRYWLRAEVDALETRGAR